MFRLIVSFYRVLKTCDASQRAWERVVAKMTAGSRWQSNCHGGLQRYNYIAKRTEIKTKDKK